MTIHIKDTVRNAMLAAVATAADAGSGFATIEVRAGGQPANANASATGTVLVTFTCSDPVFETPASGAMDLDAAPDLTATASAGGVAGWARLKDTTGATVLDGSVGAPGSGADFIITGTTLVSGQNVTLTLGTLGIAA